MFTLGLVSISFRSHTPEEILAACQAAGLSAIEWGSDVHVPVGDLARAEEIREKTLAAGMTVAAYGSYYKLGDEENNEATMRAYLSTAKALGAPVMRIWGGKKSSESLLKADKAALVEETKKLASLALEYGVGICLECHTHSLTDEYHHTLAFLEAVGCENVSTFWQPLQTRTESYNLDAAAVHAAFSRHIHVFHWDSDGRYPLADGSDIWAKYLALFRGEKVNLMLEFMHDDKLETLAETADALRSIVSRV